jgi:hypothetical protein
LLSLSLERGLSLSLERGLSLSLERGLSLSLERGSLDLSVFVISFFRKRVSRPKG